MAAAGGVPVKVFVSYAHDDEAHVAAVRELWEFLRGQGLDARLDLPAAERRQEWPAWMTRELRAADFVLVVASPAYKRRCDGAPGVDEGRGVQFEARLILNYFYGDQEASIHRFLPVLLPGMTAECIPDFLLPASGTSYPVTSMTVAGCEPLLRVLTGQPAVTEPPLGQVPPLGPQPPTGPGFAQADRAFVQADRARVTRILGEALRAAESITGKGLRVGALASIAKAMAAVDPQRAARLIADAERVAQSISTEYAKGPALVCIAEAVAAADPQRAERIAQSIPGRRDLALGSVAEAMAAADPDRAERIARSITGKDTKARTLASISEVMAAADPHRAAALSADAERIAQSISAWSSVLGVTSKGPALGSVAEAVAAADPDRAERIARSITGKDTKAQALASIARAMAAADPDRAARLSADAERTARSVYEGPYNTGMVLDKIALPLASAAEAMAAADPDRAEHIARSISTMSARDRAQGSIAEAVAAADPDRAERIARSITGKDTKAQALASIARAMAAADPDRAARLSADAERISRSIAPEYAQAVVLARVAEAMAAADPDRAARLSADAERIAQSISRWSPTGSAARSFFLGQPAKEPALGSVAQALAATDPDRAERIAQWISPGITKVSALVQIAETLNNG